MYRQRLLDYYLFVCGLGQCSILSYLKAQPHFLTLHLTVLNLPYSSTFTYIIGF